MAKRIHFLLSERLEGYEFNPHRPEGLSFMDDKKGVEIEIRASGKQGDFGFGHSNLEIRVKVSHDVTDQQYLFVETLINQRTVTPSECPVRLPYSVSDREVVAINGKIANGYSPTSDFLPKDLQELCISTGKALESHAIRFVQLLRWLEKADGPVKIRDRQDQRFGLYWKTTQEQYHGVPWPKQAPFSMSVGGGITWSEEVRQNFSQLWEAIGTQEPLGHQLLREAKSIVEHNRRGALLICYSALEVGIKQHISNCAPDAGWLAMYAPTPPLFKILRDYLPKIHGEKQDFQNWAAIKSELSVINSFTEDRNRLAHRGEGISGSLDDYLRITEDLLIAFDVFEGHTWCKTQVSHKFGEILGWGSATGKISVTVKILQ